MPKTAELSAAESVDLLRRIRDAEANADDAKTSMLRSKERYKEDKEAWQAAREKVHKLAGTREENLPVVQAAEANGHTTAPQADPETPDPAALFPMPDATLPAMLSSPAITEFGLAAADVAALKKKGLVTVGDAQAHFTDPGTPDFVKEIGKRLAGKLFTALAKFREVAQNRADWSAAGGTKVEVPAWRLVPLREVGYGINQADCDILTKFSRFKIATAGDLYDFVGRMKPKPGAAKLLETGLAKPRAKVVFEGLDEFVANAEHATENEADPMAPPEGSG